ncbi:hypothetical protein J5N97_024708 [Dioscorea zingiberensis]|uniref:Uncharacterized protein n=1 Tax=Dioscorea zingiberensis TaxID=325984 RepID=A0A9D5C773_9LILI|nr:hypothetical protein J5N97_024708 [Dioscorea zingiberensis]
MILIFSLFLDFRKGLCPRIGTASPSGVPPAVVPPLVAWARLGASAEQLRSFRSREQPDNLPDLLSSQVAPLVRLFSGDHEPTRRSPGRDKTCTTLSPTPHCHLRSHLLETQLRVSTTELVTPVNEYLPGSLPDTPGLLRPRTTPLVCPLPGAACSSAGLLRPPPATTVLLACADLRPSSSSCNAAPCRRCCAPRPRSSPASRLPRPGRPLTGARAPPPPCSSLQIDMPAKRQRRRESRLMNIYLRKR